MKGNKVSLHRSTDQGSTYGDPIASVITLEPGERVAEPVEATGYGAGHDYKEWDYGLKDGGEYNVTIRYQPAQTEAEAFIDSFENDVKEYLQLQFPAPISKAESFRCIVTKIGKAIPKEGQIDRMFTFKVDGPVTEAVLP